MFWIVKNSVRYSGMVAWGWEVSDVKIWHVLVPTENLAAKNFRADWIHQPKVYLDQAGCFSLTFAATTSAGFLGGVFCWGFGNRQKNRPVASAHAAVSSYKSQQKHDWNLLPECLGSRIVNLVIAAIRAIL
jgi:hypothetical protein